MSENPIKKVIYDSLFKGNPDYDKIKTQKTKWKNQTSEWSKSLNYQKGDNLEKIVKEAFEIEDDLDFSRCFIEATSGDGNEAEKICTLHSSSLLALLCFYGINKKEIEIGNDVYTECHFEVKNNVINPKLGNPSNVDIMLVSRTPDKKVHKLLFLESKFTEYLSGGCAALSKDKYSSFYENFLKDHDFGFKTGEKKVKHKDGTVSEEFCLYQEGRTTAYLGGIKQAISHLLGIATGPVCGQSFSKQDYCEDYCEMFKQASVIEFATIIHDIDDKKANAYKELYRKVLNDQEHLKECLRKAVAPQDPDPISKLIINPEILTYKQVFSKSELPQRVKSLYKI